MPTESELSCLIGLPIETFEEITQATEKCHKLVSLNSNDFNYPLKAKLSGDILFFNMISSIFRLHVNLVLQYVSYLCL